MNSDLPANLMNDVFFLYKGFFDDFHGANKIGFSMSNKIDFTEVPFP